MAPAQARGLLRDKRQVASLSVFLANFGAAKALIYFTPLILAAIAPAEIYGATELAQSVGLLVATFVVGAPLSGINQMYLVRNQRHVFDVVALMLVIGCALSLAIWLVAIAAQVSTVWLVVAASLAGAFLHIVSSTIFRMLGRRSLTSWADGTAALLSALIVVTLMTTGALTMVGLQVGYLVVGVIGVVLGGLAFARLRRDGVLQRLRLATQIGSAMFIVGLLAMWLGVGGRIIAGSLAPNDLAPFGLAFRVTGLALGVHQLMITATFARIYRARTREADKIMSVFLAFVGLVTAGIAIFGGWIPDFIPIEALRNGGADVYANLVPIAALQVFCWVAYSHYQLRINRSGLAKKAIFPTIGVTIGGIAAIYFFAWLGLRSITWISAMVTAHSVAFCILNAWILHRARLPHRRLFMVTGFFIVALTILCLAMVR